MVQRKILGQLFFDNIVYALQPFGGISNYWYELTLHFLNSQEFDIHFFETGNEKINLFRKNLNLDPGRINFTNRGGIVTERFFRLPVKCNGKGIFHSSYFRMPQKQSNLLTVTTVHDFIHEKYHGFFRTMLHNYAKKRAILESDRIITVSQNTRNDLLNYFPQVDEKKVSVIHNGVSTCFEPLINDNRGRQKHKVLYVGSRDHYKNFDFAVDVVAQRKDLEFVVVGNPFSKAEQKYINSRLQCDVVPKTGISSEKLNELYNEALCLFYPSSYEGFGIPIVEAMKAGCPFIAKKGSSITEVAGNAGVLLNTLSIEEGVQALQTIEANFDILVQLGFNQAEKFSWEQCYNQTRELYKSML